MESTVEWQRDRGDALPFHGEGRGLREDIEVGAVGRARSEPAATLVADVEATAEHRGDRTAELEHVALARADMPAERALRKRDCRVEETVVSDDVPLHTCPDEGALDAID